MDNNSKTRPSVKLYMKNPDEKDKLDESFFGKTGGRLRANQYNSGDNGRRRSTSAKQKSRKIPFGWTIAIDVLIAALALFVFSLYYFILPRDLSQTGEVLKNPSVTASVSPSKSKPSGTATPSANSAKPSGTAAKQSLQPTGKPAAQTAWGAKFADKFTSGNVVKTADSYKSANVSVTVQKVQKGTATYYISDIYISDLKYFKTAFASGKYQSANGKSTDKIAKANNAVIAINGDNSPENVGPVVRNGVLYPNKATMDVLVMNNDGSMQTFSPDQFDINRLRQTGAYQAWTFGPMLLSDGKPMDKFNCSVNVANPRTTIGYYEPGHYCFIVTDGRQPGYSTGLSTKEMSQLFYDLGCKVAFNLDGGQSAEMAFMGSLVNKPYNGGRSINDIIYITNQ